MPSNDDLSTSKSSKPSSSNPQTFPTTSSHKRAAAASAVARRCALPCAAVVSLVGFTAALSASCADTKGAMDDYLQNTQSERDKYRVNSDASFDAAGNLDTTKGTYILSCLSPLVAGDLKRLLRFRTEIEYAAASSNSGTLTMSLQPMPAENAVASSAFGPIFPDVSKRSAPFEGGKGTLEFGSSPDLPKEANPITNVDWGIDSLKLTTYLTNWPDAFCAGLEGFSRPSGISAAGSVCIGQRVTDPNVAPPTLVESDFHCP